MSEGGTGRSADAALRTETFAHLFVRCFITGGRESGRNRVEKEEGEQSGTSTLLILEKQLYFHRRRRLTSGGVGLQRLWLEREINSASRLLVRCDFIK